MHDSLFQSEFLYTAIIVHSDCLEIHSILLFGYQDAPQEEKIHYKNTYNK